MNLSISNSRYSISVEKMKAAVLREIGKPLSLESIQLPKELFVGQVLVKLKYSGICGAQLNEIGGAKGIDKYLPHLLGHEGYGEVVAIGPGVENVTAGDKVVLHWRPNRGLQSKIPKYVKGSEAINAGWVTTFNEYAVVSENRLTPLKISKNLNQEIYPLLGCALTTAFGVLTREAKINTNGNFLIFGAGGVGLSLISFLKAFGAKNICIIDVDTKKIEVAKNLGANFHFNASQYQSVEHLVNEVLNLFTRNIDYIYETSGNSDAITTAYELGTDNTTVILIGVPFHNKKVCINTLKLHHGMKFFGTEGGKSVPLEDIPKILTLIEENKLKIEIPLNIYTFNQINNAISDLQKGIPGRFLIKF